MLLGFTRHPDRAIPQRRVLPLIGRRLPEEEASSAPAAKPDKATAPASAKAVALPGVHCLQHEKSMELVNVAVVVAVVLVAADVRAPHGAALWAVSYTHLTLPTICSV